MSAMDEQIEQLEAYLDGSLTGEESLHVARRVADDAEWAAALEDLRSARQARVEIFETLEPSDSHAQRLAERIIAAAARERRWSRLTRAMRIGAAVAACVGISFVAGWGFHGKKTAGPTGISGVVAVSTPGQPSTAATYQVTLTDGTGRVIGVQKFGSLEQAKEFAGDLQAWQDRQQKMRDGAAVLVADQF